MLYSLTGWRLQVWLGQSIRYHKQPGESGIVLFDSAQPNQMEPSLFSFCIFACIAASGGLNGGHSGEKGFMYTDWILAAAKRQVILTLLLHAVVMGLQGESEFHFFTKTWHLCNPTMDDPNRCPGSRSKASASAQI